MKFKKINSENTSPKGSEVCKSDHFKSDVNSEVS